MIGFQRGLSDVEHLRPTLFPAAGSPHHSQDLRDRKGWGLGGDCQGGAV